ncbi:MAG: DUF1934 domain-containing protein [Pseudobutyrivibrio sp.]|nr:DUF1934 domain-containing protein [Pseudobutyrivibrio sp.]
MAGNKCTINLLSKQKMGGEQEQNQESYSGSFMDREGKRFLSYKRITEDGQIDCLIAFDRKSLTMTQKGVLNSKLELIPGTKTRNVYGTPMGDLSIQIYTRHYQVIETQMTIKILLDYDIVTGAEPIETSMDIEIILG